MQEHAVTVTVERSAGIWRQPKAVYTVAFACVIVFSVLAGASSTIGQIVGFRAGWGLGNALFLGGGLPRDARGRRRGRSDCMIAMALP